MNKFGLCLIVCFASAMQVCAQSSDAAASVPKQMGVYVKTPNGWVQLQDAPHPKNKIKGILTASMSPFGRMTTRAVYKGGHAPVQILERQPVLYLRDIGKFGRDAQIIRLTGKKDKREVLTSSMGLFRSKNSGIEDKNVLDVTVSHVEPGLLAITPQKPLEPGEYLFQAEEGALFDFGISK